MVRFRIVSNLFEPNRDFGVEALVQREFFTGRPFDKQFACKFIGPRSPEQSIIGKIYIERVLDNSEVEPLFDFVLTKVSILQFFMDKNLELQFQLNKPRKKDGTKQNIFSVFSQTSLTLEIMLMLSRWLHYLYYKKQLCHPKRRLSFSQNYFLEACICINRYFF